MSQSFCFVRVFKQNCANFLFQMSWTFLICRCRNFFVMYEFLSKTAPIFFSKLLEMSRLFWASATFFNKVQYWDRPVLCFVRGDLIESQVLTHCIYHFRFLKALKIVYCCTLATALVCQPQSVIVSPSVRTCICIYSWMHFATRQCGRRGEIPQICHCWNYL